MTDPVTNVEIEDVLSSIRRLVSENTRAERTPEPAERRSEQQAEQPREMVGVHSEAGPQEAQMLVLTPALRVEEDAAADAGEEPAQAQAEQEAEAADEPQALTDSPAEEGAIEDVIHEVTEQEDEAAPDLGRLPFIHSDDAAHSPEMSTLENRIAGLEAAVALREDDWEPDGIGDDENAGAPVEPLTWEDSDEPMSRRDADDDVQEAELAMDLSEFADTKIETGAQDEAAALETTAPDGAEPEDAKYPNPEEEEAPEPADADLSQGLGFDPNLFGGDESVIDEEALRDMVAEIVRQELQGSLGERITRNVRKLVRREIHRALAARELD